MKNFTSDTFRATVFFNQMIPFSVDIAQKIKVFNGIDDFYPVLIQPTQPFSGAIPVTEWFLADDNKGIRIFIIGNKVDVIADMNVISMTEKDFCKAAGEYFSNISKILNILIIRIAFAPVYVIDNKSQEEVSSRLFINSKFNNTALREYSLMENFLVEENLKNLKIKYNYIINIEKQKRIITDTNLKINTEKDVVVYTLDINTDVANQMVYPIETVKEFFLTVPQKSEDFLEKCGGFNE